MDDALAQASEELRAVDGLGAVGLGLRIAVMNEHQVQIRAVTELQATDLAVADDDEVRVARCAVCTERPTMTLHRVLPGQRQHLVEDRLGQPGEVIRHFHQGQRTGDLRGGHA